jgi:hypothetical protein
MLTGQISSQALQLVQAQTSSAVMRSNSEFAEMVISASVPSGGVTRPGVPGGHDLAGLEHDLARVERLAGGVRRAHAGAAAAHGAGVGVEQLLPGEVLDHEAPKLSSSVSVRFGIGAWRPSGGRGPSGTC